MRGWVCALAIACSAKALSVGLVTQYHLGSKFLENTCNYNEREKHLFLLGVWFPGIWYTSESKVKPVRFFDHFDIKVVLKENDPFKKGILFHHYLHSHEKRFFENSHFQKSLDSNMPYLIQECYLNILEDLIVKRSESVDKAKILLNEILYTDINLESFSNPYSVSDVIKWYYAIFISITTNPLEIPDHVSFSNTYKGLKVTVDLTPEMLESAKKKLPELSLNEVISQEIKSYLELMQSLF